MNKILIIIALMLFIPTGAGLQAQGPGDQAYLKWSQKDVQRILTDSPWAKQMTIAQPVTDTYRGSDTGGLNPREAIDGPRGYGLARDAGVAGDKEHFHAYTVRFYSAMPIRQAHVRFLQIKSKYEQMTPDEKRSFEQKYAYLLGADVSKDIVISLEFVSNDQNLNLEVNQKLRQATKDLLLQSAFLISDRMGRIPLRDYNPPAEDGTGAKLIFPRTIQGEPVVIARDRNAKLEFFVPGTDHKLFITWKIKDLTKNGVPEF
jgi:hypothetical protein